MKTQEIYPPCSGFAGRATPPAVRPINHRAEPLIHPAAALLGVVCVAAVFGLLWLLFSFG